MHAPELARKQPRKMATLLLATGLAFSFGAALLFLWLAGQVWKGDVDGVDNRVLSWFASHRSRPLTDFFEAVTALGSWTLVVVLGAGLAISFLLIRRPGLAGALAASCAGGWLLSSTLKMIVMRPRPPAAFRLTEHASYAFPSGHTIAGFAFFVALALLAATHIPRRGVRLFIVGWALGVGTLVGVSRLYLGAHYLSDVIGGALVGTAWSVTVVMAEHVWRHRSHLARDRRADHSTRTRTLAGPDAFGVTREC